MKNIENYIRVSTSEIAITEDQAMATRWLMDMSGSRPDRLQVVRSTLNAFRWATLGPPNLPDPLVAQARGAHVRRLLDTGAEDAFRLKGVYDLGCTMSSWTHTWVPYQVLLRAGQRDDFRHMLTSTGNRIVEYADLLGLSLTAHEIRFLRLEVTDLAVDAQLKDHIQAQIAGRLGPSASQLYALAYGQALTVTILNNSGDLGFLKPLVPTGIATMERIARDLRMDSGVMMRLGRARAGDANEVISVADSIFDSILARRKQGAKGSTPLRGR